MLSMGIVLREKLKNYNKKAPAGNRCLRMCLCRKVYGLLTTFITIANDAPAEPAPPGSEKGVAIIV